MISYYLSPPQSPHCLTCKLLDSFMAVSGLQVNLAKSQALNVSLPQSVVDHLKPAFKFKWSDSSIRYLGINLTPKIQLLYQANFPPMFHKLESDFKTWSSFQLSWLGRINSIKMTLLPRLLYLFRSLPIAIKRDHLREFQKKIIKFILGKKGHSIAQRVLFSPKTQGGLGLPNLLWYYKATRLAQLSMVYSKYEKPDWIQMERQAVPEYTLDYLMWCPQKARPPIMSPTLSHSRDKLCQIPSLTSDIRPLAHIFATQNSIQA